MKSVRWMSVLMINESRRQIGTEIDDGKAPGDLEVNSETESDGNGT